MATVHPPISEIDPTSAGEQVELDVLAQLAKGLPESYELFHRVDWANAEPHRDSHGELDIVVVNSAGDVAVLEVKAGEIEATGDGLFKQYGAQRKDVGQQAGWQFRSILKRLKSEGLDVRLLHCLVLPHYRVGGEGTIDYPRERIADADDCLDLAGFVQRRLGAGRPDARRERVRAFLLDRVRVQPDVSALAGTLQRRVSEISGGLARWVPRIAVASGVVHVRATAGSGKTQLALTLLRQACVAQKAASYVCFNRPLADQMRTFAPSGVEVSSFHQLCWKTASRPRVEPDFEALATRYLEEQARAAPDLDVLVIDELQDMQAAWVQALISRVREEGRIYLLEDPEQCVYPDRAQIEIGDAVVITARENFRSPRRVAESINLLRLTDEPVAPCAPFAGTQPAFTTYGSASGKRVADATADAVRRCLGSGYALQDIVVLCWRGRAHSELLAQDTLAVWTLRKFTGDYDDLGEPLYTEGDLTIETVRRFKGQSAPAIVLTEVDFDPSDGLWPNLLFVGLTRARLHVEVVIADAAAQALAQRLADA
ncbi:AAA family ATPase [Paraburkholderia lycopersici]|uniref:Nuclease-related domain-containing protein n=1 Tax=Paraburkholderia lycopersici TaxID=416944 RepID=A0A1G6QSY1_9BURK|nr:AAA family ATPase [Paraburkholderia lycopersici]SDC94796.1 Nuclease-related domain-containing protein [Paraburkholderia lycopersici]